MPRDSRDVRQIYYGRRSRRQQRSTGVGGPHRTGLDHRPDGTLTVGGGRPFTKRTSAGTQLVGALRRWSNRVLVRPLLWVEAHDQDGRREAGVRGSDSDDPDTVCPDAHRPVGTRTAAVVWRPVEAESAAVLSRSPATSASRKCD